MKNLTEKEIAAKMAEIEKEVERQWQEQHEAAQKLSLADVAFALYKLEEYWNPEDYWNSED